jgi:hypothetical protein
MMRSYERKGDQLVLTQSSSAIAPASRTTWARVAELEALPEYQREAVGFWQWASAGLVDASGAMVRPAAREPVIPTLEPGSPEALRFGNARAAFRRGTVTPDEILRDAQKLVFGPAGTSLRRICDTLRDKGAASFMADEQATLQAIEKKLL